MAVKITVVGDAMTDRWVFGSVTRVSPEAPCLVLKQERTEIHPGGAANVAAQVERLGGKALLVTDPAKSIVKTRFVCGHQLFRHDEEDTSPISEANEDWAYDIATREPCDALVLSDYNKGMFGNVLASGLINWALNQAIPVVVDPKGPWMRYMGCTVITPNEKEMGGCSAVQLMHEWGFQSVLETCGAQGMRLYTPNEVTDIRGVRVEACDVTGAGDVVVAALAMGLAEGLSLRKAALRANELAAASVTKWGTR